MDLKDENSDPSSQYDDSSDLESHIIELANLAINFDRQKKLEAARFYYQVIYVYNKKFQVLCNTNENP